MLSFSRSRNKAKRPTQGIRLQNFENVMGNMCLIVSSAWALHQTGGYHKGWPISDVTFSVCLIHALIGVLRYGNPQYGDSLRVTYQNTAYLCLTICPAFYAIQLAVMYQVAGQYVAFLILFTLCVVLWHYISLFCSSGRTNKISEARGTDIITIKLVIFLSLCLIFVLSYNKLNYYGISAAMSFTYFLFYTRISGTIFSIPVIDLFLVQLTFFNFFAMKSLHD